MPETGQQAMAVANKRLDLDTCESVTGWSEGATGTDNLEVTNVHRTGRWAIAFDKVAGGATASISRTFDTPKSLADRADQAFLHLWALIPDVTNVDKLHVDLGDGTNYNTYTIDDGDITSAVWKECVKRIVEPDAVVAAGMNTVKITWMRVRVVFDAAGDTLADMGIDEVYFDFPSQGDEAVAADVATIKADLATCKALLTTIDADTSKIPTDPSKESGKLSTIDTDTGNIATSAASIDGKLPAALGQAAAAGSLSIVEASDTALAKESGGNLDTIAGDTTSIDGKLPAALGQAAAAGSLSVIEASDSGLAKESGGNLASLVTAIGKLVQALRPDTYSDKPYTYFSVAASQTDQVLYSPAAGMRVAVDRLLLFCDGTAQTFTVEEDKAGGDTVIMTFPLAANEWVDVPAFCTQEEAADILGTTGAGGTVYGLAILREIE